MKTLMLGLALVLAAAATCIASENPDKYPSVGLTFTETRISDGGNGTFVASRPFILDVRIPTTDSVTVGFHGGPTTFASSSNQSRSGITLGASVRVYLPWRLVRD